WLGYGSEKVMSSRFSDILGACRREAALEPQRTISRLEMIYSSLSRIHQEKQKKRRVSLLEAYEYTHIQETTKALGNGTNEGSGDGTDEVVGSRIREYITRRSKRVADAVEATMEDEHGPYASQHLPNDFDLWEKATMGKNKSSWRTMWRAL
nr:hypothetical protein [Tanacetum cinerariifolium]